MRYGYRIFNKFNRLVEKLNDESESLWLSL